MITKIVWPHNHIKENPFGGVSGYRPLRLTFHSGSFTRLSSEEQTALDLLSDLAKLDDVDALSFDGALFSKLVIDKDKINVNSKDIPIKIISSEGKPRLYSSVPSVYIESQYIARLLGTYSSSDEEKYRLIKQEIIEAQSHGALNRDLFVTYSPFLIDNRNKLERLNICTPKEALKITGLYLRMKGEFEWTTHIQGNCTFRSSRRTFYEYVSRGLLPNNWKFLTGLGMQKNHEELIDLGWSVLKRYSRALQARDEISRLFYLTDYSSLVKDTTFDDQMTYHFDYFTVLMTAALDAEALIINKVFELGLSDSDCGIQRCNFKKSLMKKSSIRDLYTLLVEQEKYIKILFGLRNKIHSLSLDTDFYVPRQNPNEFIEYMYQYNQEEHWGIQKGNVTLIKNHSAPVPSINYTIDTCNLTHSLMIEGTKLINMIMEKTIDGIDSIDYSKLMTTPPPDMIRDIDTYLLLV